MYCVITEDKIPACMHVHFRSGLLFFSHLREKYKNLQLFLKERLEIVNLDALLGSEFLISSLKSDVEIQEFSVLFQNKRKNFVSMWFKPSWQPSPVHLLIQCP